MNRLLIIAITTLLAFDGFSQISCSIKEEYTQIFKTQKITSGELEYLFTSVQVLDSSACLSPLINNNIAYINYINTHFTNDANYQRLLAITDSILLQQSYIANLKEDTLFNGIMQELEDAYLGKQGFEPDTVTLDELLNIAVKYFSILRLTEEGHYVGKVCAGINGIKETEMIRAPHVEAFCFSSILTNYGGEPFSMHQEFIKGMKQLYTINLGIDDSEKILRAQGALYMFMKNNESLKQLLLAEYERKKESLPFVLVKP
jgi:hypothetical protein